MKLSFKIFDFETTWSEFQKPSQTATELGKAELRILDFKTKWSEFQMASQTANEQGEAKLCILKHTLVFYHLPVLVHKSIVC